MSGKWWVVGGGWWGSDKLGNELCGGVVWGIYDWVVRRSGAADVAFLSLEDVDVKGTSNLELLNNVVGNLLSSTFPCGDFDFVLRDP